MEVTSQHRLGLIPALVLCLCLLAVAIVLRRWLFHPLSSYPGPWLGKFSDLTTIFAVLRQERTFKQFELLQRYGSPIRMGTNNLVFADMETFAQIYGQSSNPCPKDSAAYGGLSATGEVNVLNVVDRDQHARLRRLISHSFSLKSLLENEDFLLEKVDEFVSVFQDRDGQSVDILEKTYELFLDIVSQLSFGQSFDCLSGKTPTAHRDVQAFFTVVPAMSMAPILRYLPSKRFREGLKGLSRLQEFSRAHVEAYMARSADKSDSGPRGKFLHNLAMAVDAETGTKLTQAELVENAIIFLAAGSGTTAATTIYLIWECGRHPEVRKRLTEEIRARFPDPAVMPSYQEASKLVNTHTKRLPLDND
jgi:cytochrome P450